MAKQGNYGDSYQIPGSERSRHLNDEVVGPADENKVIQFQIYLKDKFKEEKDIMLEKIANQLPSEREYLSTEELASKYGASKEDIDKVKAFVEEFGLKVEEVNPGARKLTLSGSIGLINKAFKITLQEHNDPDGRHIGRDGSISIPSALSDTIQGVYGLSRRNVIRPVLRSFESLQGAVEEVRRSDAYLPTELAKLYNFPTNLDGSGQCIAILEFGGGFHQSELKTYFSKLGIPLPNISAVGPNQPHGNPNGIDGEVLLDIEVSAAIAPKAKIVVYFFQDFEGELANAITTVLHDTVNRPSVISISYGLWEEEGGWTKSLRDNVENAFIDAALSGVTICVASGDNGSSCMRPRGNNIEIDDDKAHVIYPGSSPLILSCGGTNLEISGTTIINETVWNENGIIDQKGNGGGATGGGISSYFEVPSYQKDLSLPPSVNGDGRIGRGVPDVSGYAAAGPGIDVIVDGAEGGIGGTSAVAPLWAGLIALLNQGLGKPVGFINKILYEKAAPAGAFHDIVKGDNGVEYDVRGKGRVKIKGYKAQSGWDACTGLGSPNGKKLLDILKGN